MYFSLSLLYLCLLYSVSVCLFLCLIHFFFYLSFLSSFVFSFIFSSCLLLIFLLSFLLVFFLFFFRHPDRTCEVLEVKCHSPFMENRPYNNYNNKGDSNSSSNSSSSSQGKGTYAVKEGLSILDRGPADSVATWHIPQLQLHILCAGRYPIISYYIIFYHILLYDLAFANLCADRSICLVSVYMCMCLSVC